MRKYLVIVIGAILAAGMIPLYAQEDVFLRVGCLDEPKTLNIWAATDVWSLHTCGWFYPSLYYRKPVTLEPLPDMCTLPFDELKANSPDGLTFTLPLRDDVKWDDGTPVTAYDFEFAYDLIEDLEFEDYLPIYEDVRYFVALDDYTLEIKLRECTPQFEESVIYTFAVPKQQFDPMLGAARRKSSPSEAFLNTSVTNPVSAGPFSFDQWKKGSYVKLVTNPDYYGKGRIISVKGVGDIVEGPWYDGLYLKLYDTIDEALEGIKDGEVDYIWSNLEKEHVDKLQGNKEITIKRADELGFYYLAPNMTKKPFDDKMLLQALTYLVDKEYIVSKLLKGYGGAAHSVVMPAAGDWYNNKVNKFGSGMNREERIAKAKEMLTEAGYTIPDARYPGGVIKLPNGTPMQPFEILTPPEDYDPIRAEAGVLIQDWWRELGVPVTVKHTSFSEIVNKTFETMTFDWYILGWKIGGSGYPDHMRYFFHSDQAVPDGNNPMGYKNSSVDKYLENLMTLCDRKNLIAAALKTQEIIIDDVAYCPLYYRTMNEAHRNDTFTGWFTQLGGIAGNESPRYCLLYLMPPGFTPPTPPPTAPPPTTPPPTTPPPTTPPPTTPPPTTPPPTTPPTTSPPTTTPPPGGFCLGTVFIALLVIGGNIALHKRK
jgi:peptide/nickel transport system substrate-binding protein